MYVVIISQILLAYQFDLLYKDYHGFINYTFFEDEVQYELFQCHNYADTTVIHANSSYET